MPVRWRDLPEDSDEDDNFQYRQYEQTLMYGRYTRDLGDFVKAEARRIQSARVTTQKVPDLNRYRGRVHNECSNALRTIWKYTFARVGEDWVFLAVLGILMACVSFLMDFGIAICNGARIWLYRDLAGSNVFLQYLSWVSLPICLIIFSAGFVHLTAPQAVGSGIPEMKTILRGVVLKEYLTFKTLVAKIIGLTATLGTGLPLGKEGPFVHIASIVATLLSRVVTSFKGLYENESRHSEMLAAAAAVGVACSFAAPIGGVLFSIEVTSVYFAVRNYWRGFFAAVCGAMMFRLLAVWFNDEETLTALFKTHFQSYPFDPMELFVFALTGVTCGFLGAAFVWVHRQYVIFMRRNKKMKGFLQKSRLLYPFLVILVYGTLSFPPGFGMLVASELTTHQQVVELFSNISWVKDDPNVGEFEIIENWRTPLTNVFVNLFFYIIFTFGSSVVASTLPVPTGIFIPVLKMGAALGRIVGEVMAIIFPSGITYGGIQNNIVPGGYSIVGAAAFAGAVTHTISTSVIVFELTGQITHILPVMVAVLIANGIAQLFQPSIYDSIIKIKKLPYLPDILTSTSGAYNIYVEDFMIRDVKYIWYGITYRDLKKTLVENKKIRALPLVDSPDSMVLLGSIRRSELIELIEKHVGTDRSFHVVNRWKQTADRALEAKHEEEAKKENDFQNFLFSKERSSSGLISFQSREQVTGFISRDIDDEAKASSAVENIKFILTTSDENSDSSPNEETPPAPALASAAEKHPLLTRTTSSDETIRPGALNLTSRPSLTLALTPVTPSLVVTKSSIENLSSNPHMSSKDSQGSNEGIKPSRFAVTKVETPSKNESSVTLQVDPVEIPETNYTLLRSRANTILSSSLPRKSILKKTRSFILKPSAESFSATSSRTPYVTVHAGDSKLRQTVEAAMRKRGLPRRATRSTPRLSSIVTNYPNFRAQITAELLLEKSRREQEKWEEMELAQKVDFSGCHVDPAPFQLVERTSLLKVHSLFSMLGLNHAYVTAIGRLIGVVALKELRRVIEETNLGEFPKYESECGSPDLNKRSEKIIETSGNGTKTPPSSHLGSSTC